MLQFIKKLFSSKPSVNFRQVIENGGQLIDVRTENEFKSGHIKGSKNIPLATLKNNLSKIDKSKPVITCCASGMRSASARSILKSNGFDEVYNGGGWVTLQNKIL